jgi:hypothetical protein
VESFEQFADLDSFVFTLHYFDAGEMFPECIAKSNAPPIATNDFLVLEPNDGCLERSDGILRFMSSADDSVTQFKIIGLDLLGNPQEETLYGPNKSVVSKSVKEYRFITSIMVYTGPTVGTIIVGVNVKPKQTSSDISCPHKDATVNGKARVYLTPNILIAPSQYGEPTISGIPHYGKGNDYKPKAIITIKKISDDSTNGFFDALEFVHNMTIPKGNYSPSVLCKYINDSLTSNTSGGDTFLENDMLKSSTYRGVVPLFMLKENNPSEAEADGFTFKNQWLNNGGNASWIGSSQFQLSWNSDTKTFIWDYLHTPFYEGTPPAISVNYARVNDKYSTISSTFGVAIASVSPDSFWEDLLGFNTKTSASSSGSSEDDLQLHTTVSQSDVVYQVGLVSARFPSYSTKVGTTTTNQFVGSDTAVIKTHPYYVPTGVFNSTLDADNTNGIVARTPTTLLSKSDTTGYFYIDITSNFQGTFLNTDGISRSVNAVITRYENTGSYTIAGQDSGVVYVHDGESQVLQSLKIRILNPDKSLASTLSGIGSDNTVILQVVKASG